MVHCPILKNGLLVMLIILLSSCNSPSERPSVTEVNSVGNEINNILNGGYVAHQGDWIFYIEPDDHNYIMPGRQMVVTSNYSSSMKQDH